MPYYSLEDLFFGLRRRMALNKLVAWKRRHTRLYPAAYKVIKPEYHDAARQMYIRRCIEISDVFVDIYWYIKRSEHRHHEDYIYYRCNWKEINRVINRIENRELPERVNLFFDKSNEKK